MIREAAQQRSILGLENRLEYAIAAYSQAYVQEFLRQSYAQYRTNYKESHAWFQMIDGLRNANTKRYAGNLVRTMLRKPKEERKKGQKNRREVRCTRMQHQIRERWRICFPSV